MTEEDREEENDKSIVDALGQLGWVEEKEEKEKPLETEDNLKDQLNFFMEENKRLIEEISEKIEKIQNLEQNIQELYQKAEDNATQSQAVQKLYETIENRNDDIENLNSTLEEQSSKFNTITNDQVEKIKELTSQIEQFQSEQAKNQDLLNKIDEKEIMIKELKEQLQFLETDTIQKSNFEKIEVLI